MEICIVWHMAVFVMLKIFMNHVRVLFRIVIKNDCDISFCYAGSPDTDAVDQP